METVLNVVMIVSLFICTLIILNRIEKLQTKVNAMDNIYRKRNKQTQILEEEKQVAEAFDLDHEIYKKLREGQKLHAIKKAREVYPHFSLGEAKKYVEELEGHIR